MNDAGTIREALTLGQGLAYESGDEWPPTAFAALDRLEAQIENARYDAKAFERNFLDSEVRAHDEKARAVAAEQRVAFLVAEAHGWQPKLEAALAQQLDDAEFANNAARSVLKGYLIEHDYVVQRVSRDRTAACVCWTCRRARSVLGLPPGVPIWPKAVAP